MKALLLASLCLLQVLLANSLNLDSTQCEYLLKEFSNTFLDKFSAKPTSCTNEPIKIMWSQTIQRVYGVELNNFDDIRGLSDQKLAALIVNAAAGSLTDPQNPMESSNGIRINSLGQYEKFASQNSNRITSLQTICFLSILALASSWYHFKHINK